MRKHYKNILLRMFLFIAPRTNSRYINANATNPILIHKELCERKRQENRHQSTGKHAGTACRLKKHFLIILQNGEMIRLILPRYTELVRIAQFIGNELVA